METVIFLGLTTICIFLFMRLGDKFVSGNLNSTDIASAIRKKKNGEKN